jgi:hypothetical protein
MTEPDVPTPCMCFATPPVMRGRVVCECVDQTESDCNHPAAYIIPRCILWDRIY